MTVRTQNPPIWGTSNCNGCKTCTHMYPQLWSTFHAKSRWQCLHQLLLEGSFTGLHGVQPDFCQSEVTSDQRKWRRTVFCRSLLTLTPPLKRWKACQVRESEHQTPCSWSHDHAYPISALLAMMEQTVRGSCLVFYTSLLSIFKWPDPQPNFQVHEFSLFWSTVHS